MSATAATEWTIRCDHPRCRQSITAGDGESYASIRQFAGSQGWYVSDEPTASMATEDFCHEHWPRLQPRVTREQLITAVQHSAVTGALAMLDAQGGGPADLADALLTALLEQS